jgi:hypothetical protein
VSALFFLVGRFVCWLGIGITCVAASRGGAQLRVRRRRGSNAQTPTPLTTTGKVWRRKALQDLQDETHFSGTELQALLSHFEEVVTEGEDRLDRDVFFERLGNGAAQPVSLSLTLVVVGCLLLVLLFDWRRIGGDLSACVALLPRC